jgi:mono/diheme cytochrome c family protein
MARRIAGVLLALTSVAVVWGVAACGLTFPPPLVGNAATGQTLFVSLCQQCHTAAALKQFSSLITNNLGTLDAQMADILLTNQQIADIQAYIS